MSESNALRDSAKKKEAEQAAALKELDILDKTDIPKMIDRFGYSISYSVKFLYIC